jgi:hypothetical protein
VRSVWLAVGLRPVSTHGSPPVGVIGKAVIVSGPYAEDFRLPPVGDVLAPWRDLLERHTNDATTSLCKECKVGYCDRWRWARERLVEEGALSGAMAIPRNASESMEAQP